LSRTEVFVVAGGFLEERLEVHGGPFRSRKSPDFRSKVGRLWSPKQNSKIKSAVSWKRDSAGGRESLLSNAGGRGVSAATWWDKSETYPTVLVAMRFRLGVQASERCFQCIVFFIAHIVTLVTDCLPYFRSILL
jgi:hypothetical protein